MMKSVLVALGGAALSLVSASPAPMPAVAPRQGGNSWMGTNLYFLQGLLDSEQDSYIDFLASAGAKVVRVWVNRQSKGCQKGSNLSNDIPSFEDQVGEYNWETLDALDSVIDKIAKAGMKVIISPHDSNSLLGDYRKDCYYDKWGPGYFYEEQEAFDAYDARLSAILNYKGATSGKVWKEWGEAILSFNLQNEPMTPDPSKCQAGDEHKWLCGRAEHLRSELGENNPIKVSTGGVGGDISHECTFIPAVTECDAVDLISVHRYAGYPGNWAGAAKSWVDQSNGKLVYLEEWGVNTGSVDPAEGFPNEAGDMNSVGLPAMYWQFLPDAVDSCPYNPSEDDGDKFGIFINGGTDIPSSLKEATNSPALQQGWGDIVP